MKFNPFEQAQEALKDESPRYSSTDLQKFNIVTEGLRFLQEPKDIFAITRLSGNQVNLITRIIMIGQWWEVPEFEQICNKLAVLQLSKDGLSRKESVQVLIGLTKKKSKVEKVKDALTDSDGD
jgi:hypothetical protein